jgi:hypothetical protein
MGHTRLYEQIIGSTTERGIFSTRSLMMLRWISSVPPAIEPTMTNLLNLTHTTRAALKPRLVMRDLPGECWPSGGGRYGSGGELPADLGYGVAQGFVGDAHEPAVGLIQLKDKENRARDRERAHRLRR